jgi:hypothetical protein
LKIGDGLDAFQKVFLFDKTSKAFAIKYLRRDFAMEPARDRSGAGGAGGGTEAKCTLAFGEAGTKSA